MSASGTTALMASTTTATAAVLTSERRRGPSFKTSPDLKRSRAVGAPNSRGAHATLARNVV
jgi:hypothetical protein